MWNIIAWAYIILALLSAPYLLKQVIKYPQRMKIMNAVWVLTALWASVLAIWAYLRFGQTNSSKEGSGNGMKMNMGSMEGMNMNSDRPLWEKTILSSLHCGAGCTLADLIGESFGYLFLRNISGWSVGWQWGLDYLLALLIGVGFQYAAIHKMTKLSAAATAFKALKIDFLSLTAWQLGMYCFMYVVFFISPGVILTANQIIFWAVMQLAMLTGFVFAYPVNLILIRSGYKPSM
ncbi:MAG: DUF4396 domain-containing protein [Bacteroidales bacterium]